MKINRLNIGAEVQKKVKEKGITDSQFAKYLGIARQNIKKTVFEKRSLDTELLCRISEVLEYNFFDYYKSDSTCNNLDYITSREVKAVLTVEMGAEKQDRVFRFVFGNDNIKIE